jgi:hypothetical protein
MSPILTGVIASGISGNLSSTAYESIATYVVSSPQASITLGSIPQTYKHLQVRLIGRTSRADYTIEDINLQMNGDTGSSSYTWHRMYSNPSVPTGGTATTAASAGASYINSIAIVSTATTTTGMVGGGIIDILDYTNTNKYKTIKSINGVDNNQEANGFAVSGFSELMSGNWMNTAAVTSLTFTPTTGSNIIAPTHIALYGIKG